MERLLIVLGLVGLSSVVVLLTSFTRLFTPSEPSPLALLPLHVNEKQPTLPFELILEILDLLILDANSHIATKDTIRLAHACCRTSRLFLATGRRIAYQTVYLDQPSWFFSRRRIFTQGRLKHLVASLQRHDHLRPLVKRVRVNCARVGRQAVELLARLTGCVLGQKRKL